MKSNKYYLVIFQDEYNNLYYVGKYSDLNDSIEDLNDCLTPYNIKLKEGDIREYASTYSMAFDTDLSSLFDDREDLCGVMVRGFILEEGD